MAALHVWLALPGACLSGFLSPTIFAVTVQDLAVSVRTTGVLLLNYASGRVTEGFYAVMVRQ